jgi:hypothetical protein
MARTDPGASSITASGSHHVSRTCRTIGVSKPAHSWYPAASCMSKPRLAIFRVINQPRRRAHEKQARHLRRLQQQDVPQQ